MKFKNPFEALKPLNDLGKSTLKSATTERRIVSAPGVIITYGFKEGSISPTQLFNPGLVDNRLIEIATANPDADFTKFETALGITIHDVQRRRVEKAASKDEPPKIYI